MKLHLPSSLRFALLAILASVTALPAAAYHVKSNDINGGLGVYLDYVEEPQPFDLVYHGDLQLSSRNTTIDINWADIYRYNPDIVEDDKSEYVTYYMTNSISFGYGEFIVRNNTVTAITNHGASSGAAGSNISFSHATGKISLTDNSGTQGGAVYNDGQFSLTDNRYGVEFSNNSGTQGGGAIYNGGTVRITNSGNVTFDSNTSGSSAYGGAIYNKKTLVLNNNSQLNFTNNSTEGSAGGAIYSTSSLTISGNGSVLFDNNKANASVSAGGGAIYAKGTTLISDNTDVTFSNNWNDRESGGAIANYGTLTLRGNTNLTFDANSGATRGGAICNYNKTYISGSTNVLFENNEGAYGGAIASGYYTSYGNDVATGCELSITGNKSVEFSNNVATSDGGAIWNGRPLDISDNDKVTFSGNRASKRGGALFHTVAGQEGVAVTLRNNKELVFSENRAVNSGGAIDAVLCSITGNDKVTFSGNSATSSFGGSNTSLDTGVGGAIYNDSHEIHLDGNGDIEFSGNKSTSYGNAIMNKGAMTLNNNDSVTFSDNETIGYVYNRAVYHYTGSLSMDDNKSVTFSGNKNGALHATSGTLSISDNDKVSFIDNAKGALSSGACQVKLDGNGSIVFSGNTGSNVIASFNASSGSFYMRNNGSVTFEGNVADSSGGAIEVSSRQYFEMSGNGKITFSGNSASGSRGGGISATSNTVIQNNGEVTFSGNTAYSSGGAIYSEAHVILQNNEKVSFSGNSASSSSGGGGALSCYTRITLRGNGSLDFSGNVAQGNGGAIDIGPYGTGVHIIGNGDVTFSGNVTQSSGGTIYVSSNANKNLLNIAGNGDVTFRGNLEAGGKRLRSIYNGSTGDMVLSATTGKNIAFYDSVYSAGTVSLNKDYTALDGKVTKAGGAIVFSGATTEADLLKAFADAGISGTPTAAQIKNSRTSNFAKTVTLYGGSLEVRDQAIFSGTALDVAAGADATVLVDNAAMTLSGALTLGEGNTLQLLNGGTLKAAALAMDHSTLSMDLSGALATVTGNLTVTGNAIVELSSGDALEEGSRHLLLSAAKADSDKLALAGLSGSLSWEGGKLYYTHASATDLSGTDTTVNSPGDLGAGSVILSDSSIDLNGQAVQNNLVVEGNATVSGGEAYNGVIEVNDGVLEVADATKARALVLNSGIVFGEDINTEHVILKEGIVAAVLSNISATVEKATEGTVYLAQSNAVANTRVNAGTLVLDADGATGGAESTVNVGNGATLVNNDKEVLSAVSATGGATVQGSGYFSSLALTNATFIVGNTQPRPMLTILHTSGLTSEESARFDGVIGTTTVETFTLNGSTIAMDITRLSDGSAYGDKLVVTGTLTATNVSTLELTLLNSTAWYEGDSLTYNLFDVSALSGEALDNALAALDTQLNVTLVNVADGTFAVDTTSLGVNGSVKLTALKNYNIPEPVTSTLSLLALAAFAARRRRTA